jgi:cyclophilin family peptidyl-prolyl cis-trans isomerase
MQLPKAYLDVSIGGTAAGRITVQLRTDVAPKTCANFMALCTGEKVSVCRVLSLCSPCAARGATR